MKIPCENCICLPMCKGKKPPSPCSIMVKFLIKHPEDKEVAHEIFSMFPNGIEFTGEEISHIFAYVNVPESAHSIKFTVKVRDESSS